MDSILKLIAEYEAEYRPLPFWSWNDKLKKSLIEKQIDEMKDQGMGGFFMHARGGLETEYLSDEWLDCIGAGIEKGKQNNMAAWCYDENGWPSGFADGKVPQLGYKHHIKWIELRDTCDNEDTVIRKGNFEGKQYYIILCSNPYYVDTLSSETISEFIKSTHEKYYEKFFDVFGKVMPGFFTDEPQYKVGKAPWSLDFSKIFIDTYGYDILEKLIALFKDCDGCEKVRNDYWNLVAKLFRESMGKQVYDWCNEHNAQITGHVMHEDNLMSQIEATGGAMGYYENLHIPGIDWLTRSIASPIIPKQVGSAARQLGRKKVLSEMFALCGWDVSFNDLKWIAEWQFVNGVNLICQHLQGYTIRGFRKRDYPASLFVQQPWWEEYHNFNKYFSKLGALLANGDDTSNVLMLHPMNSQYVAYNLSRNDKTEMLEREFLDATETLSANHINYHFGDEYMMSKYASVLNDIFIVGKCRYNIVVLPYILNISKSTFELLKKFSNYGGKIYSLKKSNPLLDGEKNDELSALFEDIIVNKKDLHKLLSDDYSLSILENREECKDIHTTCRMVEGKPIWFVVNLSKNEAHNVIIRFSKSDNYRILDLENDSYINLVSDSDTVNLEFKPTESYLITIGEEEADDRKPLVLDYPDVFDYKINSENAITLDSCEYRLDNGDWKPKTPVIELQTMLTQMRADCDIEMKFLFDIRTDINSLNTFDLVTECADKCTVTLNGNSVKNKCKGNYIDSSFERIDIKNYIKNGENELVIKRRFYQSKKVYDVLFGENVLETERNKLTYDTELESIYLIGDFAVYSDSEYKELDNFAIKTSGPFYIGELPEKLKRESITEQGFAFFSGSVDLNYSINISKNDSTKYIINTECIHDIITDIFVNNKKSGVIMFAPYNLDITDYLENGENNITLRLYSGNRNLLGPHHHPDGECFAVAPHSFGCNSEDAKKTCLIKFGFVK